MDDYEILATIGAFDVFDLPAVTAYCEATPDEVTDVVHRYRWLFEANGQHQAEPTWKVRYPAVLRKLLTQLRPPQSPEVDPSAVPAPDRLTELPPADTLVLPQRDRTTRN